MRNKDTITIRLRNDTIENWEKLKTVPLKGEIVVGLNGDEKLVRIGDGVHKFRDLPETTDLVYALEHGYVLIRNNNPLNIGKVQFRFLSDELQAEVDEGNEFIFDTMEFNELFAVKE